MPPAASTMSLFLGINRPGRGVDHRIPFTDEVKGRVAQYICTSPLPAWYVTGRIYLYLLQIGYRGEARVLSSGVIRPGLETIHPPPCSFESNILCELHMHSWIAQEHIFRLNWSRNCLSTGKRKSFTAIKVNVKTFTESIYLSKGRR